MELRGVFFHPCRLAGYVRWDTLRDITVVANSNVGGGRDLMDVLLTAWNVLVCTVDILRVRHGSIARQVGRHAVVRLRSGVCMNTRGVMVRIGLVVSIRRIISMHRAGETATATTCAEEATTTTSEITSAKTRGVEAGVEILGGKLLLLLLLLHLSMNSVGLRHIISAKSRLGPILRARTICESIWIEFILASIPHIVLRAVPSPVHPLTRVVTHAQIHAIVHAIHSHSEASHHPLIRGHRVHRHAGHSCEV